jgi:diacylglycerol kinase (ATP)
MKSEHSGIKRIWAALKNSVRGLKVVFKNEQAFRHDVILCSVGAFVMFAIPFGFYERIILGFSLVFILFAELVNSAIEATVDRIGSEYHILSKNAKDIGSAIVFVSLVWAGLCWGVILLQ